MHATGMNPFRPPPLLVLRLLYVPQSARSLAGNSLVTSTVAKHSPSLPFSARLCTRRSAVAPERSEAPLSFHLPALLRRRSAIDLIHLQMRQKIGHFPPLEAQALERKGRKHKPCSCPFMSFASQIGTDRVRQGPAGDNMARSWRCQSKIRAHCYRGEMSGVNSYTIPERDGHLSGISVSDARQIHPWRSARTFVFNVGDNRCRDDGSVRRSATTMVMIKLQYTR
jgi:hypothetical protein